MSIPPPSVFVGHGYLQDMVPECNGSRRLKYHVYLVTNDVQVKGAIPLAHRDSLTARIATEAHWPSKKVENTYGPLPGDVKTKLVATFQT